MARAGCNRSVWMCFQAFHCLCARSGNCWILRGRNGSREQQQQQQQQINAIPFD